MPRAINTKRGGIGIAPADNKFHVGASDGKHYWLTPPELHRRRQGGQRHGAPHRGVYSEFRRDEWQNRWRRKCWR